jgi:hypothetical protein
MIGRTQLTKFVDDGSRGACEHLLEGAQKRLREALELRDRATQDVRKAQADIKRFKSQLRVHLRSA